MSSGKVERINTQCMKRRRFGLIQENFLQCQSRNCGPGQFYFLVESQPTVPWNVKHTMGDAVDALPSQVSKRIEGLNESETIYKTVSNTH